MVDDLRYVAVYNLQEGNVATVGEQIEGLRLHAGGLWSEPLQIGLGELSEGRVARVFAHGLDGFWAILRLRGAGDTGQPG